MFPCERDNPSFFLPEHQRLRFARENTLTMRTPYRSARPALLLTLALCTTSSHAQDLAELAGPRTRPTAPITMNAGEERTARSISDDGNGNERVPVTRQLVVTHSGPEDVAFTLDILDEWGRVVSHNVLDPARGQRFWTVDVNVLASGRYAARLLCAEGAVVNRFRRD